MKLKWAIFSTILFYASSAIADEPLIGMTFITGKAGQPFCTDTDSLKEMFIAMINRDNEHISSISGCAMIGAGRKIVVLDDLPSDADFAHVVKIRAFGTRGSTVGYTFSIGLSDVPETSAAPAK